MEKIGCLFQLKMEEKDEEKYFENCRALFVMDRVS